MLSAGKLSHAIVVLGRSVGRSKDVRMLEVGPVRALKGFSAPTNRKGNLLALQVLRSNIARNCLSGRFQRPLRDQDAKNREFKGFTRGIIAGL